jgi:phosphohistidine phosphatase
MKLILVRHGEATSTSENPERPLTITGRRHAESVATWLESCGHTVDEVFHSEKLRARQTAKIFGNRLGVHAAKVRQRPGLKPHDDPGAVAGELAADGRSVMVVGHLPFLNRLASTLLVNDADRLRFRFVDAGAVVLASRCGGWEIEAVAGHDTV